MPFFEFQKERTKIVPEAEEAEAAEQAAAQGHLVAPELPADVSAQEHATEPDTIPLPSRKTKPIDWKALLSGAILSASVIGATVMLAIDAASRHYALGLAQEAFRDYPHAIESFSQALAIRKDPVFYVTRADAYSKLQPALMDRELSDLVSAIKLKSQDSSAIRRAAFLATKLGQKRTAVELNYKLADLTFGWNKDTHPYRAEAAYNLLLLGNDPLASQVAREDKSRKAEDHGYESVVQALIYRETGRTDAAQKIASEKFDDYCSSFYHAERIKDVDGRIVPEIIQTVLLLDRSKVPEAAKSLAKIQSTPGLNFDAYPIVKLLGAWVAYDQGDFKQCLHLTDAMMSDENASKSNHDDDNSDSNILLDSAEGLNLKAAAHLLREHVFLEQKNMKQAMMEARHYQDTQSSGKVFTPMPYRKWLAEH